MAKRVLFLVNGLGLGNSTRCHAVIAELVTRGAQVDVVTSGNGLWYFEGRPEVASLTAVESLYYAKRGGAISIAGTLGSLGAFWGIVRRNAAIIEGVLSSLRPDAVVSDSVYISRPIKRRGIPLLALNNADVVVESYRRWLDRPPGIAAQFWAVESTDHLFHRWVPDLVLSPTLWPELGPAVGNHRRIGPIARRHYDPAPTTGTPTRIVVMLSGSVFGTQVRFERPRYRARIDVVGRAAPTDWVERDDVRFHGRLRETLELLRPADLVVLNGGFSAVSEAFCMRKPMIVVPVPRHAEQWVNGRTIVELGVGLLAEESAIESTIDMALDRIDQLRGTYARLPAPAPGAAMAADLIMAAV